MSQKGSVARLRVPRARQDAGFCNPSICFLRHKVDIIVDNCSFHCLGFVQVCLLASQSVGGRSQRSNLFLWVPEVWTWPVEAAARGHY